MTQAEFEALLADESKRIDGDIAWSDDEDQSPAVEFRAEVRSDAGYPLFVRGSFNAEAQTLTYALIHRGVGRIYALDLGKDHHNPTCEHTGERHKHRWSDTLRDKEAYVPADITAPATDPAAAWQQFCVEARIKHDGALPRPPARQLGLL
jgi:hypothetical protein